MCKRVKALNRFGLGIEGVEDRHEMGDREQVVIPGVDAQQLQAAARLLDRAVGGHQLSEATAVDVGDVLEIQNDLRPALRDEAVHFVFDPRRSVIAGQLADEIEYRHATDGSLFDSEVHD